MYTVGPGKQRVLKFFIALMLPVFTLAGFGGFASIALLGLASEKTISATYSPDGHYRARVLELESSEGCGRYKSYAVLVDAGGLM